MPTSPVQTYFVELQLKRNGTLIDRNESEGARMCRQVEELRALAREVCRECHEVLRAGISANGMIVLRVTVETRQGHPWFGIPRARCTLHEVDD